MVIDKNLVKGCIGILGCIFGGWLIGTTYQSEYEKGFEHGEIHGRLGGLIEAGSMLLKPAVESETDKTDD